MPPDQRSLQDKIDSAPDAPGCYLYYDRMENIIYVGKSKCLRERVRSYFVPSAKADERIAKLIREICDISYVTTETELDALMEEYRLIKLHRPWFNAQHIRTLRPHFLRFHLEGAFPAVEIVQEGEALGEWVLGPFKDSFKAEEALDWLNQIWNTPLCGKPAWPKGARPCLYHGMGRCFAPCRADPAAPPYPYRDELAAFLAGTPAPTLARLQNAMAAAISALHFEEAGQIKASIDQLDALARKIERGFHITPQTHAILLMRGFGERDFSVFYVRDGRVRSRTMLPADMAADAAADQFIGDIQQAKPDAFAHPAAEACLMEISAYRQFALLPPEADLSALRAAYMSLHPA